MTIHKSPLPDVALRDMSITDRVLMGLQADPGRIVAVDGPSGASMSGAQMEGAIRELAGGLQGLGDRAGIGGGAAGPQQPGLCGGLSRRGAGGRDADADQPHLYRAGSGASVARCGGGAAGDRACAAGGGAGGGGGNDGGRGAGDRCGRWRARDRCACAGLPWRRRWRWIWIPIPWCCPIRRARRACPRAWC